MQSVLHQLQSGINVQDIFVEPVNQESASIVIRKPNQDDVQIAMIYATDCTEEDFLRYPVFDQSNFASYKPSLMMFLGLQLAVPNQRRNRRPNGRPNARR